MEDKEIVGTIEDVLKKRKSKLWEFFKNKDSLQLIDSKALDEARSIICDEFAEKGINSEFEPNEYGLFLEDLIDMCSRELYRREINN